MKQYEKPDWGYAGKLFGSCMTVLGLATGLAVFSAKPTLEQTIKKEIKQSTSKPEISDRDMYNAIIVGGPIASNLMGIVGDAADTVDIVGTADIMQGLQSQIPAGAPEYGRPIVPPEFNRQYEQIPSIPQYGETPKVKDKYKK